ncbi:MAG: winged helix DNA-binding domain-containing protein, partial [Actinomycetota bacterium]
MSKASEDRLRRLRQAAQLLHRPSGKRDPADVVQHLVGLQAQVPDAAALGLRARTRGLTSAAVDRARFKDRSIVWTWAMRGTLHIVAAEDLRWLHPLTVEASIPRSHRRLVQEGVPASKHEAAVSEIRRILKRSAPLTRPQLAERLRRKRIRTEGQAIAHLVWLAAAKGVCCYGPEIDEEPAFVLLDEWVGARRPLDRDAALAELAVRYLRSHGPATVADLAGWSGIKASDANHAWQAI